MNNYYNKEFQLWCTSHLTKEEMKEKYNFEETENLKLYSLKEEIENIHIDLYDDKYIVHNKNIYKSFNYGK